MKTFTFKPRARILQLLGEQLIGSDRLAVFELVKNGYDADAEKVTVTLGGIGSSEPSIIVEDDGEGMDERIITDIWLEPGSDHRQRQRDKEIFSKKFKRLPLGEKGVGRFAVHKLGDRICVNTRRSGQPECRVVIEWSQLIQCKYLADAQVHVEILDHPQWFPGDKTGTRLAISGLKEVWNRGKVRELKRDITSICSPFEEQETFRVILQVPGHGTWLEDLLDVREVLDLAIWRFSFKFDESGFSWKYRFIPPPGMRLDKREADKENAHLLFPKDSQFADLDARSLLKGIGRVRGKLYAFDLDRGVVGAVKESSFIRSYLNEQGGIRVYRNGLRVYNYGTQGDNWLGLDLKRVQNPTRGISNNLVLGAVNLDLKSSSSLKEKTNREGFVENEGFKKLRDIVLGSLSEFLTLRGKDKERMRLVASSGRNLETRGIDVPLAELRRELVKRDLSEKLGGYVDRIAAAHNQIKEVMLNAGAAGLNLALVFHEVDRGVRFLHEAIRRGRPQEELINQSSHLTDMLGDMVRLLKRGARTRQNVVVVVNRALKIFEYRFRSHGIKMICPPCESSEKDPFVVRSPENMLLAAISNLLDNAIYWTGVRWPKLGENSNDRKILVTVSRDLDAGPALIIADNGPGFSDDPETLVRPFFTHKPDGMGLGLYYASLALQLSGGELVFPEKGDVALPPAYDGAIIGMVFNNTEKREP